MRLLIAIIVVLVIVDGYFYDWRYSRLVRDQAIELMDRIRWDSGEKPRGEKT